jgi:hypothetical protein
MSAAPSFHSHSLIAAWAEGARFISEAGRDDFIVTLSSGVAWEPEPVDLRRLDQAAMKFSWERPSSVSEMILPAACEVENLNAADAIERGLLMLGRARRRGTRFSGWKHTYFERMVGECQDKDGNRHHLRQNKLLSVIEKLNLWNRNAEAACYIHTALDSDTFRTRGGPCLQYVQFRAHGDNLLDVIGLYRAHDYGNKALGNLIGLNRLGRFVGHHTGRRLNAVAIVSLHPFADHKQRLLKFANHVAPVP